jgi:Peptidase family M1 domain
MRQWPKAMPTFDFSATFNLSSSIMRHFVFSLIISCLFGIPVFAQLHDNAYRNSDNPNYWQNRMPDKAYWQQDVSYKIFAVMVEDSNYVDGAEVLEYWNNSPDTLNEIYFHLYQNAFIKGSYLHDLEMANNVKPHLGKKEAAGLGIVVSEVTGDGVDLKCVLDNTIMKVLLARPLAPGQKTALKMKFKTYFDNGATRRRMQMYNAWGFMHYNGVQWFPKACVYDRMHGWDTYQHLNKEFYGDFGLYDVILDFPSNYILEATGELKNRFAVLPEDLRSRLDIKNFANKKWEEPPSTIIPYKKGERKEWHFLANNVHDFAFTADPSYRIGTAYWNGVECVALVQEPHAALWQNAPDYITKIVKTFSEEIGMYRYPKIVAADARDGMEYPMLTLDGGSEPGYRGLFTHEIGHNWFYGQVGSNETYRAAMDEGFTQFLTSYGLRKIDGDTAVANSPKSNYRKRFTDPTLVLDRNVTLPYVMDALNGNETAINTHSDDFNSGLNHGGGYREVYFKTATMLYNLQLVLGDSLFKVALHHYFEQWKFAHPYFEDFRASVIGSTHVDLSWFFDEWFETTKTLDYGIGRIKHIHGTDDYAVTFKRKGEMQMPLDFTATAKDGKKYSFYIPNSWFQKETEATVLPKWYGWGKLNSTYTARVTVPGGLHAVMIDTTYRFGDKNLTDNYRTRGLQLLPADVKWRFDGGVARPADRRHYDLDWRPDVWWNAVDGIKAGLHFEGNYLYSIYKLDGSVWWNTHLLQASDYQPATGEAQYAHYAPVSYTVNFATPLMLSVPKLQFQVNSQFLDGIYNHKVGFLWAMNDRNTIRLGAQAMWAANAEAVNYLINPNDWSSFAANPNTSINADWTHNYGYMAGVGRLKVDLRAPLLTNGFNYSYVQAENVNYTRIAKLELRTRVFGRYGAGNNVPWESGLYMAGASPEDLLDDKYTRSRGWVPGEWDGISEYDVNHFQSGGGLNLRGYAGYFAPDYRGNTLMEGYKSRSGASANAELDFENYIPLSPKFFRKFLHVNLYGFADAGVTELDNFSYGTFYNAVPAGGFLGSFHADAGLGMAFTIRNWGVFDKAKPLTLRLDLPIFLNRSPFNNTDYATVRYVVGINRAF